MAPQGGPEGVPRCCVIEPDRSACLKQTTAAGCDEAAIRRESYRIDLFLATQGAYLLIGLCVEDYHAVAGIAQAGCNFGSVRRIGHTVDSDSEA